MNNSEKGPTMRVTRYLFLALLLSVVSATSALALPANKVLTVQLATVTAVGQLVPVRSISVTTDASGKAVEVRNCVFKERSTEGFLRDLAASRGVIASACVTTLVEGGWELKRYDVPAQCVLLEYSGCRKHWHADGVPTALSMRELKRILS